jgi:hypothetical protein
VELVWLLRVDQVQLPVGVLMLGAHAFTSGQQCLRAAGLTPRHANMNWSCLGHRMSLAASSALAIGSHMHFTMWKRSTMTFASA